ncbi:MAG TPA: protein kinase [Terriglobia bacterium]|nr:protein kinase [Terriglobia bacterium]
MPFLPERASPLRGSMNPERWERVKELFEAALELEGEARFRFIAEACQGDEPLRLEVASLLSGHQNAGDFMKSAGAQPAPDPPTSDNPPSALSVGQTICDRYQILRFIGRGGMGEVYEAKDLKLRTRVALKTIRPEISANPGTRSRFEDEIRLARRIRNRSVCGMYHLEFCRPPAGSEKPEITFIIMELLEGENLSTCLGRQGRMTAQKALPLVRQMADGLAAAHHAGVVHCDFKPGNVMLVPERPGGVDSQQSTESLAATGPPSAARSLPLPQAVPARPETSTASWRAVITDFGLARAIAPSAPESVSGGSSGVGQLIGTPAYMAPEQLEGRKATSAADIYALGLVIYEMVTGRRPFEGDPYQRLRERAPSPRLHVADLDPRWESAILRCLEREPAARYAGAQQVAGAIDRSLDDPRPGRRRVLAAALGGLVAIVAAVAMLWYFNPPIWQRIFGPPLPDRKNLVVVPIEALDGGAEELARCAGLTDTVTNKLAQLDSVEVPAAEVVRERHVDSIVKARTQLGATMVLGASWKQAGQTARINLSLVDATTGGLLRTDSVTAAADDEFSLQDQVVIKAAEMLALQLSAGNRQDLTAHGTGVLTAYDFYVQGLGYLRGYEKPASLDLAISLLQRAIAEDPHYAQAHATLSLAYWYKYNATRDAQWAEKAKAAVDAAAKLNSGLPEVQLAIGDESQRTGDYQGAITAFQRAVSLDPRSEVAYEGLGRAYDSLHRLDEAEKAYKTAVQVRPACWECYDNLGTFFFYHARYDEALNAWQTLIALAPDIAWGYMNVGDVYLVRLDFNKAEDAFRSALKLNPESAESYSNLGTTSYYLRQFAEEANYCERAVSLQPKNSEYWANLGDAYYMIPADAAKAREAYRKAIGLAEGELEVNPRSAVLMSRLAQCHARENEAKPARDYLAKALALAPNDHDVLFNAAVVHLASGERQEALKWLAQAVHGGYAPAMLAADPQFDKLRSDPEFQRLVSGARGQP